MNDKQNSELNMFQSVVNVLDANESKYASITVFDTVAKQLKINVVEIRETDKGRSEIKVKASSAEKQLAEDVMVSRAVVLARIVNVYAFDTDNQALMMQSNVTKSQFYKLHDNEALALSKTILDKAMENKEALSGYGLTEVMTDDLEQAIGSYEALVVKPRDTITERKGQTKSLAQLFAETKSLLYDRLDKLMSLFKESEPLFYESYFSARSVINTAARKRKES